MQVHLDMNPEGVHACDAVAVLPVNQHQFSSECVISGLGSNNDLITLRNL